MASYMLRRAGAYQALFVAPEGSRIDARPWWMRWIPRRAGDLKPPAEIVLRDLARICYANRTTAAKDPVAMGAAEGRRQVWLHIVTQMNLSADQIERLTTPRTNDE